MIMASVILNTSEESLEPNPTADYTGKNVSGIAE
jgi:hypothetical protein